MILHCLLIFPASNPLGHLPFNPLLFLPAWPWQASQNQIQYSKQARAKRGIIVRSMILALCERHPGKKVCLFKSPKFYVRAGKGKMLLRKFYTEDNTWVEEKSSSTTPIFHSTRLKPLPTVSCRTSLLSMRVRKASGNLQSGKHKRIQNGRDTKKNKT